jgi:hypothetical protein
MMRCTGKEEEEERTLNLEIKKVAKLLKEKLLSRPRNNLINKLKSCRKEFIS